MGPSLDLEFLNEINALYKQYPKHQRESFWRVIKKRLEAVEGHALPEHKINALVVVQQKLQKDERPDFELGARLLKAYIYQSQKGDEHVNQFLKRWVLNGLESLSNGEKSEAAFGLQRAKGRPLGTTSYTNLQIACAYHYFLRQGHKKTEAEKLVEDEFHIEKRTISRIKKRFPISDDIDAEVLKALMEKDYSDLYGQM